MNCTINWDQLSAQEKKEALARPGQDSLEQLQKSVWPILESVKERGDRAIREWTLQFDGVELDSFLVSEEEFSLAKTLVDQKQREAIEISAQNIREFHEKQKGQNWKLEGPGKVLGVKVQPIESVGLYVPGGTAPLPSTVLMLGIPAQVAGCESVSLMTPPQKDGSINPAILVAAEICGLKGRVYKIGGAQAIAAMAFGTESIPRCFKICGPGNSYVTMAKQLVALKVPGVAIDMPAGPSEVMVLADGSANPRFVAADLLAQAEHGVDSQVVLVTTDEVLPEKVRAQIQILCVDHPRLAYIQRSLEHSRFIVVANREEMIRVANDYASEHLIIQMEDAFNVFESIRNAGSVFIGHYTPESVGDYSSGTNHVLPTSGYAKSISGLSLQSFTKTITYQMLDESGLRALGPIVETLAQMEGLEAHGQAVSVRLEEIGR